MEYFDQIAVERRALADDLERLTPEQWATQSSCSEWTVREVAAHLNMVFELTKPGMVLGMIRHRGDFNKFNDAAAKRIAQRPTSELVASLRANAEHRFTPPGFGSIAPLSDIVLHGQDIRRPLGIERDYPSDTLTPILEARVGGSFKRFAPTSQFEGLRFVATDMDWYMGEGPEVSGTGEVLALATWNRPAGLAEVSGDGADTFRQRLAA